MMESRNAGQIGTLEEQRLAILIDVQNMFYSALSIYKKKLNFETLLPLIVRGRRLTRSIAYVVQTPEVDQTKFLDFLVGLGVDIKSKKLKVRPDGSAKGDWDMGLAIDAINLAQKVDVIALVTGDGDFVALVEKLKAMGVRVEVYSFPGSTADELRQAADYYHALDAEVLRF
jgi:uncharacterized LabA/DUF88 family protein